MVKKKGKKSAADKAPKTRFFNMLIVLFKKRPYIAIGGAFLMLVIIILLFNVLNSGNDINSDFQTAVIKRGDLIAIVGATGIVEPNQSVELNWETIGRVEIVYVAVNDMVEQGDILAELADNTLPQSVILAQADLVSAKRALEDLVNSNTESALAYTNLLEAEQKLRDAENERDKWNFNDASDERIFTARSDFLNEEENYKAAQLAYDVLTDFDDADPQKLETKESLDEEKLKRDKALRTLNYVLGKSYDQQVAEDFADYDVALAQLEDAQREWERMKDGPNADDISAAEAKVAAAEATVSLGKIEAPFGGTITKAFPKVGDEVTTGSSAFRVDDLLELFVEVEISEVDINRITVGQKADLTFDAIIGETFTGKVIEVSSVGNDNGSGVDFLVTLQIIDPIAQVRPGMTAAVNIIVSEIKDVLSVPNRAVRLKEGQRIVYILKDGEIQEVEVEFGSSSDIYSEIVAGDIEEGDLIVLNPPMEFVTDGGPPAFMR
jgi:HlyD family secretion protein